MSFNFQYNGRTKKSALHALNLHHAPEAVKELIRKAINDTNSDGIIMVSAKGHLPTEYETAPRATSIEITVGVLPVFSDEGIEAPVPEQDAA